MSLINSSSLGNENSDQKVVYREINGVTYTSTRPAKYRGLKPSPVLKQTLTLYKSILKFPDLVNIWDIKDVDSSSSYNKTDEMNSCSLISNSPSLQNIIVPLGKPIKGELKELNPNQITLLLKKDKKNSNLFIPPFTIYCVFYLFNGLDIPDTFLSVKSSIKIPENEIKDLRNEDCYVFEIKFNKHEELVLKLFKEAIVSFTVVKKGNDNEFSYSKNLTFQTKISS